MKYKQNLGVLTTNSGEVLAIGYSGHGEGKNNSEMQHVKNVGPIPRGIYTIGDYFDSKETGPLSIQLIPHPGNAMFGRSGFLIHGDNMSDPGNASHGCIILPRKIRELIINMNDKTLEVL